MKTVIFLIMTFLMSSALAASTKSPTEELSVSYTNVMSNDKVDEFPAILLDVKPKGFVDFEFQVAISSGLLELKNESQKDNHFINKVLVYLNYRF